MKRVLLVDIPPYIKPAQMEWPTYTAAANLMRKIMQGLKKAAKSNIEISLITNINSPSILQLKTFSTTEDNSEILNLANQADSIITTFSSIKQFSGLFHKIPVLIIEPASTHNLNSLMDPLYKELLASRATAVIISGQDASCAITKERSIINLTPESLPSFIWGLICDEYYSTVFESLPADIDAELLKRSQKLFNTYKGRYLQHFERIYGDKYRFGSITVRINNHSFLTTLRGKESLNETIIVTRVCHITKRVFVCGSKKATLNAPLLSRILENPKIYVVVHYHEEEPGLINLEYAMPGTVRDSRRDIKSSFNIKNHGCFLLFDKNGIIIK